ncbi:MAG: CoA transferase [Gammaproteobacteria bacterium]|nr:CoA transferase [Gammaproteobacteria bacterium]
MPGPLTGITVLDLSRILAGPWATQLLADYGAEVIKLEKPGEGDDTRRWGPPYLKDAEGRDTAESAYYLCANRGKRSLSLDFTRPEARSVLLELVRRADVLVENYKLGGLAKYGLDYQSLKAVNPRLVYCSITGYGQTGPEAAKPGYDAVIQGMGGLMSLTGVPDGEPGAGPQKVGVAVVDLLTGLYAATAILAALRHRDASGEGQYIDLALFDTQLACLANQATNYLVGGVVPSRQGTAHPNIVPYQAFECADGHLMLAVGNDGQFARAAAVLGRPEWAGDARYAENASRVTNRRELVGNIAEILATAPKRHWLEAFVAAGVPASPINDLAEAFAEPQGQARGMRIALDHPQAGQVELVANPVKFSATPVSYSAAPPLLGADTEALLAELGVKPETVSAWREGGVI